MNKYMVRDSYTIKEVMEQFEENHDRVAIVVNDNERVIGVISQGDIIEALCAGTSIYTRAGNIIKSSFLYLDKYDLELAYQIFKDKKITMLPVLDKKYMITDIITLDTIYQYLENKGEKNGFQS